MVFGIGVVREAIRLAPNGTLRYFQLPSYSFCARVVAVYRTRRTSGECVSTLFDSAVACAVRVMCSGSRVLKP